MNEYKTINMDEDKIADICTSYSRDGWKPISIYPIVTGHIRITILFERPIVEDKVDKTKSKHTAHTAVDRAVELMDIPRKDLPTLAVEYCKFLCYKYGVCGEVMLTAYAHYAQAVEKLPCSSGLYMISTEGEDWFNAYCPPENTLC